VIYILNTPILTSYGDWRFSGPISTLEATEKIELGFQSAIGHESSAYFLSELLNVQIPCARIQALLNPGDSALVFRIKTRLPEGRLLSANEIKATPFELGWLERLS
jgi:hypothetical protein